MALTEPVKKIIEESLNPLLGIHNSWTRILLSKVCIIQNGFAFESEKFNLTSGKPLIRIRDIGKRQTKTFYGGEYSESYVIKSHDLLIGMDGDFNCSRWKGPEGLLNQRVCKVKIRSQFQYNPKFLEYALPGYLEEINKKTSAVTVKHLSSKTVEEILLPFPPLPEQGRIVEKIETLFSELDAGVAALKRAQANLKRYKASLLKAACEGRLVPTEAELAHQEDCAYEPADVLLERILTERRAKWEAEEWDKLIVKAKKKTAQKQRKAAGLLAKLSDLQDAEWENLKEEDYSKFLPKNEKWKEKYKTPQTPATENLPELPEGWVWGTVGQVSNHRLGKMLDKSKNQGTSQPYLRNINVRWFHFDMSDLKQMKVMDSEYDNVSVQNGDVVICEGGEPGRASVWEKEEQIAIQKALHRVRLSKGIIPWFFLFTIASNNENGNLSTYFTGSTIKHFTGESLDTFTFAIPPTNEQIRITNEIKRSLSLIEVSQKQIERELIRAQRLRQSILKRAFEGKLVPQDPKDGSASELLGRIKEGIE